MHNVRWKSHSVGRRSASESGHQAVEGSQCDNGQQGVDRAAGTGEASAGRPGETAVLGLALSEHLVVFQLFVTYGNQLANQVWAPAVPAMEELHPKSSDQERSKFIREKYSRGRYRRVHVLTTSQSHMDQVCPSAAGSTFLCPGVR